MSWAFHGVSEIGLGAEALMYLHSDLDSNIIFASEAEGAVAHEADARRKPLVHDFINC